MHHLSLIKLRKSESDTKRLFSVPLYPVIPIIGAGSCILLMYYLSDNAKVTSVVWFFGGLLIFLIMTRKQAR